MITHEQLLDRLNALIKLDIDAVNAYQEAIEKIDVQDVKVELERFKSDHQRHITDLSLVIQQHGGTPTKHTPDFKGYLIEGFTALRSITGTAGALKAMKTNEELTNNRYKAALELELPQDVRNIVQRNFEDEQRHLRYIENAVEQKVWERTKAA